MKATRPTVIEPGAPGEPGQGLADRPGGEKPVLRRDEGAICFLTINRPERGNSISAATHQALMAHLEDLRGQRAISVIVLSGAGGKVFCAGHDLTEIADKLEPDAALSELMEGAELMKAFRAQPQIIVARVEGVATAAGCQLVAGADLAIAERGARFATPGVNIGLWCYGPMVDLGRNVPRKKAMHMLVTGRLFDAEFALEIGLVNEVVDREDLDAAVLALATEIASKSGKSFAMGKPAFYGQLELPLERAYAHAGEVKARHIGHADAREGIQAFLEKRKPSWVGRDT